MADDDRPVYTVRRHRAEDLMPDDVTKNRFGKWDVVQQVKHGHDGRYVHVHMELGGQMDKRSVDLVEVQVVKK